MARDAHPITRIHLARSLPRILAVPLVAIAFGAGLAAAGLLLVGGTPGIAMAAGGVALSVLGLVGVAVPLSVRVHVEESIVRVAWLFGRRVYLLTPGSLTRIHLHGEGATPLRSGFRFGWALGPAVLRNVEEIHIVRLAPTETVILIPTARGRLGIATSDERHLIEALTRAAHARARAEEAIEAAVPEPEPAPPAPSAAGFDPRLLTGIERRLYEESLARHAGESAAGAAAPPEPTAQSEPAAQVEPTPEPIPDAEPRRLFRRPSWARRRPSEPAPGMTAMPPAAAATVATSAGSWRAMPERVRAIPISRPRPSWLLPLLPLAAAGGAWAAGVYLGQMPELGSDTARLTALALVLAGPGTTIGALMARTWWPRTVGVVVMGGLVATVFIGRALLPV